MQDAEKCRIYYGLDFGKYLTLDAVSKSSLVNIVKTPAHYKWALDHPIEPTPAMIFGSAVDCWITEGEEKFRASHVMRPPGLDLRSTAGRAWRKEAGGKTVVPAMLNGHPASVPGVIDAIARHERAQQMVGECVRQVSLLWTDEETGLRVRGRPDFLADGDRPFIMDLKTSGMTDPESFAKQALALKYHWQAAMYLDGASACYQCEFTDFYFLVVDPAPPHPVELYRLGEAEIELGRSQYRDALRLLDRCLANANWPSSTGAVRELVYPTWAWR
jgi:hypothetical protein